ncbi:hypothetical protein FRX31_007466 [Thalictrum thalictroides]|uniref:DUF4283 domain-containing protein n=1 Tax=Thalictrum thalictroides TaxID=46969 RepID=A0A7J6X1L5_THATH|nr:hypothetical protein FRX31_007466 [Thalictrum thalictroides]
MEYYIGRGKNSFPAKGVIASDLTHINTVSNAAVKLSSAVVDDQGVKGKSFAAIVKPKYGRNIDTSSLPVPGKQGDFLTISLIEDEVDKGIQHCLRSLVGRIDMQKVNLERNKTLVRMLWNPTGDQGSWIFDKHVLRLSKWSRNFSIEKETQSHAAVWVKFPGLSLEYWEVKNLLALEELLVVHFTLTKQQLKENLGIMPASMWISISLADSGKDLGGIKEAWLLKSDIEKNNGKQVETPVIVASQEPSNLTKMGNSSDLEVHHSTDESPSLRPTLNNENESLEHVGSVSNEVEADGEVLVVPETQDTVIIEANQIDGWAIELQISDDDGFIPVVGKKKADSWRTDIRGTPILRFEQKLKMLKIDLKAWNSQVFGMVDETIKHLQLEFDGLQFDSDEIHENETLLAAVEHKQLQLQNVLSNKACLLK